MDELMLFFNICVLRDGCGLGAMAKGWLFFGGGSPIQQAASIAGGQVRVGWVARCDTRLRL
jgi:hypothetical protein